MNAQPLVSIIINNYNYGSYLKECIDSALSQSYSNTEVIVVDDGSTDHSQKIMDSYKEEITQVIKENGGQASAFNAGFLKSNGDYILFLDADDYLSPDAVEKFIERFDSDKVVKVHWFLWRVDEESRQTGPKLPDNKLAEGDLRNQVIELGPAHCGGPPYSPPTSGNAWSREFLQHVLPMPEEIFRGGADNYLFVLAPIHGLIKKVDEALGYYRVHGSNNTVKPSYIKTYMDRFEQCCRSLSHFLKLQGIVKTPDAWPRDHWFHKVHKAMEDLITIIPEGGTFILADDNHWMADPNFFGRKKVPFMNANGNYGGVPADNTAAVEEIELQKLKGAEYIVFPWTSYWYLDHYSGFQKYLDKNASCILENESLKVFDLRDHKTISKNEPKPENKHHYQ